MRQARQCHPLSKGSEVTAIHNHWRNGASAAMRRVRMKLWIKAHCSIQHSNQKHRKIGANLPGRGAPIFSHIKWFKIFNKLVCQACSIGQPTRRSIHRQL
ncbi:hypothetical protein Tsp_11821 [Trichinella spiralis]|uniref:hypothetical protein n=1 Tax=Trichinella spiralis TaxID=6334 RepID=UPI0001EFDF72|nr:hypothetical protein Tsp_11821 [Trichinella spiralis]